MLLNGLRETDHRWQAACWEVLKGKLPAWLVERLGVFRPLIVAIDEAVRKLSGCIEADAPDQLPKGMGRLTHENVESEVRNWQRFKNRPQVGSYAGLSGGVSTSGQSSANQMLSNAKAS